MVMPTLHFSIGMLGSERQKKIVPKLIKEDQIFTKQEDKQEIMDSYYQELMGSPFHQTTSLNLDFFHTQSLDLLELDAPILETEIWATIKELPADCALGPDGFTGRFYKARWPILKPDFMAAILTLQQGNARKLWMLNSAYITLISKKENAVTPKNFHPISLIHNFGKLIMKVMANKLAPPMDQLVASNQSAFIRGHCIHDNYPLVQETIRHLHSNKV
jgi:hypothetical protein